VKIVIFGANGGSGKRLVDVALAAGHDVVAAVRSPDKVAAKEKLRAVKADVLDRASVMAAVEGADAVLSTIGPTDNKNPGTLLSEGTKNMVAACEEKKVARFVWESGLMVDMERKGLALGPRIGIAIYGFIYGKMRADKMIAEASIQSSSIPHWVIVRPPMLDDSPARGDYIHGVEARIHPGHALSHADVAAFMLRCATDDEFGKTIQRVGHR
jgi:nucleoside-diphosphate-sugar epimerase